MRCNWSTGGSPAVAILAGSASASCQKEPGKVNICVYLAKAFTLQSHEKLMAPCTLHSHGDQSLLKILLKRLHLTAQEILKYFLSVCSELVVAFGPEDVGRRRVEKISETVAKCCQRAGMFRLCVNYVTFVC